MTRTTMKYLITGGAGFIGSHLVEHLVGQGDEVRVLDNLSTGKSENLAPFLSQINFVKGDIRDLDTCKNACEGMHFVLHHAALGSVPRSVDDPATTNEVNITGTLNLLLAAKEAKVKRFVFASSSSVYGDTPVLPKVETMNPSPLSPYALSKYTGETYTSLFFKLYGLETVSLRYFNVFGPRQDPNSQYAAVIPRFISSLVQMKQPTIYGDGEQSRDFTYIADVVRANLLACQAKRDACGDTYNIACCRKTTVNDLFFSIRHLMAQKKDGVQSIDPIYDSPRPGDVRESLADYEKARARLNYKPQVEMKDGLAKTIGVFSNTA